MKIKVLVVSVGIFMSSLANAGDSFDSDFDFNLKFGGWSKHISESYDEYNYNESHNGVGFDLNLLKSKNGVHNFGVGYFQMEDSFYMDNVQGGVYYKYSPNLDVPVLRNIEYNLSVVVMRRGWIYRKSYDYNDYRLEYKTTVTPLPYITYNLNKYINIDAFYIPQLSDSMPQHTFFGRLGVNLTEVSKLFNNT